MSLAIAIVQSAAPRTELGAATATAGLSGQIGSTVGSAVVGGVVGFGVASLLPTGLDSHTLTPALVHAADPALQAEIAAIYHDVFSPVFLALAGVYILGFIAALLLPDGRLSDDAAGSADTAALDDSAGLALQGKD